MEHESNSYSGEVEDISVDKSGRETSTPEAEITDQNSNRSLDIPIVMVISEKFRSTIQHETSKHSPR
jgi:hypothetical protein